MRRSSQHTWIALPLLASLIACDPHLTAPAARIPSQASLAANVEHGTGVFSFDAVHYWDCVGENVPNAFDVTYSYTRVTLPSGEYVYRELWPKTEGVGTITGLTSGHVWRRDIGAGPLVDRSTGGGMLRWTGKVYFVSETGPRIVVSENVHLSRNANGEVKVDRFESTCKLS